MQEPAAPSAMYGMLVVIVYYCLVVLLACVLCACVRGTHNNNNNKIILIRLIISCIHADLGDFASRELWEGSNYVCVWVPYVLARSTIISPELDRSFTRNHADLGDFVSQDDYPKYCLSLRGRDEISNSFC